MIHSGLEAGAVLEGQSMPGLQPGMTDGSDHGVGIADIDQSDDRTRGPLLAKLVWTSPAQRRCFASFAGGMTLAPLATTAAPGASQVAQSAPARRIVVVAVPISERRSETETGG